MANISKLQFLRTETAKKVPTAAQLGEGSLAINIADKKIFTKDSKGAIVQLGYSQSETDAKYSLKTTTINGKPLSGNITLNSNDTGSLAISNRLSELSGQGITDLKGMLDNIEVESMRPMPLEQFQGTGAAITSLGDTRLTEKNQTITVNSNSITDGPIGYGAQLSASVLVNIRRAYSAGMVLAQILYVNGGVSFIRTSGSIATVGDWKWNGLTSGADANGWRKNFDSAVLPSLSELGAAKSGVNSDITQLNNVSLINGDTNFAGSIYQTGGARTFQNNYRIGLIREANPNGNVNPYITFVQKDIGDGNLLPKSNRVIGRIESKVASPTTDDYGGRSIGAYQQWLDPAGNGITQMATYDSSGVVTMIDAYAANGNIGLKNKDITGLTNNQGSMLVGSLANMTNAPLTGAYLLGVATRDTGTGGGSNTYIGHNGGTPDTPIYSHYFRGKGSTNIDTQLGMRVAKDFSVLGTATFATAIETSSNDMKINFNSKGSFPTVGINYSAAGNFGFWDATPGAGKWQMRRDQGAVWHFDGGLSLEYADVALSNIQIASGANDSYIRNVASNKYLQLKNDGTLAYSNQAVYHAGNKPTAVDVGALPITGGTVTGVVNINATGGGARDWHTNAGGGCGVKAWQPASNNGMELNNSVNDSNPNSYVNYLIGSWYTGNFQLGLVRGGGAEVSRVQLNVLATAGGSSSSFMFYPNGRFQAENTIGLGGRVVTYTAVGGTYLEAIIDGNAKGINFFDSDRTLKENVENADGKKALSIIEKIRPVSYKFKDYKYTVAGKDDHDNDIEVEKVQEGGEHQYGVIAQELEEIYPEAVITNSQGKKALDPLEMIGFLITTCHEQQKLIKQIQEDVAELKK